MLAAEYRTHCKLIICQADCSKDRGESYWLSDNPNKSYNLTVLPPRPDQDHTKTIIKTKRYTGMQNVPANVK